MQAEDSFFGRRVTRGEIVISLVGVVVMIAYKFTELS